MSFTYEKDDWQHRVLVTVEGPFVTEEAFAVIARHAEENAWRHGILYDLRRMTGQPTNTDLREIMKQQSTASGGRRGPIALVVSDPNLYSRACAYKVIAPPGFRIEVFRDRTEADSWLASHTAGPTQGAS